MLFFFCGLWVSQLLLRTGLWPSSLLIASLVTLIAVGKVNSLPRLRGLGYSALQAKAAALYWVALAPVVGTEALPIYFDGHHLGSVDCWLSPTIHQIFGDNSAKFPRLAAWRGGNFLLLRAVWNEPVGDGNVGDGSLRTSSWGTQWGQLNQSFALSWL